jgi:hypothetical protein
MASECEMISAQLGGLFHCERVGEYTRVQTPLLYPDGDIIDVFVKKTDRGYRITDLGESVRWLKNQTASARRTKRQLEVIVDICKVTGVQFFRGALTIDTNDSAKLAERLMDVTQASLRVSDLSMAFRARSNELFSEEVEEFLLENRFSFAKDVPKNGRSGKIWKPNFEVRYDNHLSLVFTLSSGNRAVASAHVNRVCTALMDLQYIKQSPTLQAPKFISLIDDNDDVWDETSVNLLSNVSDVAYWRKSDEFVEMLKSA